MAKLTIAVAAPVALSVAGTPLPAQDAQPLSTHAQPAARPAAPPAAAEAAAGSVVGALGYMSPAQLKGQDVDESTDVFSLGAVLYETLAGRPAFPGRTAAERIAAILNADPPPLAGQGIPAELNAVLSRAFSKDRARRYPSAAAFLTDLRAVASGEFVAVLPDTLAVIDFQNLSQNADDAWIGSGIAESLAIDLARVPGLEIVAREKVLSFRPAAGSANPLEPAEIGRRLGCRGALSRG